MEGGLGHLEAKRVVDQRERDREHAVGLQEPEGLGDAFAGVLACLDEATGLLPPDLLSRLQRADIPYLREEIPKAIAQSLDGINRIATIVGAMKEFSHPGGKEKSAANLNKAILTGAKLNGATSTAPRR